MGNLLDQVNVNPKPRFGWRLAPVPKHCLVPAWNSKVPSRVTQEIYGSLRSTNCKLSSVEDRRTPISGGRSYSSLMRTK
jgi:hypothetical protein